MCELATIAAGLAIAGSVASAAGSMQAQRATSRATQQAAENTAKNYQRAMNGGTIATGTGYKSFEPLSTSASFQPTYSALLLRGYAPGATAGWIRHFVVRKVLSADGFELEQSKDKQQGLKVKWQGYYISSAVAPFALVDQTA